MVVNSQKGWSSLPAFLSDSGSIITINSADNEFNSSTLILKNNDNIDANRVDAGNITLTYYASFSVLTVIIGVWN